MIVRYGIEDYPDEWLMDPNHDDDWEAWCARREAMYSQILGLAEEHGCVMIERDGIPLWHYLHRGIDGQMRLTAWDELGPIRHTRIWSAQALARKLGAVKVTVSWEER